MSTCATCFEVSLKSCPQTIVVDVSLIPETEYYWVLKARTGKLYQRKVSTDSQGRLYIDASVLPDGLLNSSAGAFILEIREGANYLNVVPVDDDHDCIAISFSDVEGDAGDNNVIFISDDSPETIDMSHLKVTVNATGACSIILFVEKINDDNASRVDWGDGNVEDFAIGDQITAFHTYNAEGVYVMKIYPIQGFTVPTGQAVSEIRTMTLSYADGPGQAFLTIGNSFSRAEFLIQFSANGLGIASFPSLPLSLADDQLRNVSLKGNQLNGQYLSQILIDLDYIGWDVGYVDLRNNPGVTSLTGNGELAKQSLIAKGWTFHI